MEVTDDELEELLLRDFHARLVKSAKSGKWMVHRAKDSRAFLHYSKPIVDPRGKHWGMIRRVQFDSRRAAVVACMLNSGEYKWGNK